MDIVLVVGGLVLLFVGGEGLVRGSVALAETLGLSKLLIGLTVVGFGTSAPELLVSVDAALRGAPEVALGNVIGSNTANVFLILGIAAVVVPMTGWRRTAVRDALVATVVALALFGLVHGSVIGRIEGAALVLVLVAYLTASYWLERREDNGQTFVEEVEEFEQPILKRNGLAIGLVLGGLVALVFGAEFLVRGAVSIASAIGVPEAVIGLTIVAVGTSLPELATAIVAARRRHFDVILGNVIGSNIFNVLAILGVTTLIQPIEVAERFAGFDVLVMLVGSVALVLLLFWSHRIGRTVGLLALGVYVSYTATLFLS